MQRLILAILGLSLVANGALAGLIAGNILAARPACTCDGCGQASKVDGGPYPTGWVVPDGQLRKPTGAKP